MADSNRKLEGSQNPVCFNEEDATYATSTEHFSGARKKRHTAKGMAFQTHINWQNCQSAQRKVSRQMNKIDLLTGDYDNVHIVHNELNILHEVFEDLQKAYDVWCRDVTTEEETAIARDWYEHQNNRMGDFIDKTGNWTILAKRKIEEQLDTGSIISKLSNRSKASSRASSTSARARERAKAAELMAKAAMLEKKQALQNETEKFRLQESIAIAQARERAYAQVEQELSRHDGMNEYFNEHKVIEQPQNPVSSSPKAPASRPTLAPAFQHLYQRDYNQMNTENRQIPNDGTFGELLRKQNDLTELLAEQHQHSLLPSLTLAKFNGDPTDYSTFIRGFVSQFESKLKTNAVRLSYLEQYLEGQPKELIKGCLYMDPKKGYPEAKRLLEEKYGDTYRISNAYLKKVTEWPTIKPGDDVALDWYSTFLTQCLNAMDSLSFLNILDHPHNLQNMVKKLPLQLQDRWRREANKTRLGEDTVPKFSNFAKFVKSEARIATDPVFSRAALGSFHIIDRTTASSKGFSKQRAPNVRFPSYVTSYATSHITRTADPNETVTPCFLCNNAHTVNGHASREHLQRNAPPSQDTGPQTCPCCSQSHLIYRCGEFKDKSIPDRVEMVKHLKLCFNCLRRGHSVKECFSKNYCQVDNCNKRHHSLLHQERGPRESPPNGEYTTEISQDLTSNPPVHIGTATTKPQRTTDRSVYFQIVPLRIQGANRGVPIETFAILDDGSSDTLIRSDIADQLGLEGVEQQLTLGNIQNIGRPQTSRVVSILVTPTGKDAAHKPVMIERVWTVQQLNVPSRRLVRERDRNKWKHLKDLDIPAVTTGQVGLLVGVEVVEAMIQHESRRGLKGQPYAVRTDFGWAVAGVSRGVFKLTPDQVHIGHANCLEDPLQTQVEQWWKTESFGTKFRKQELRSIEDERALKQLRESTRFRDDLGHYETGLLWRKKDVKLPNNRILAEKRLTQLEQNLDKNEDKAKTYYTTMESYISKGYAKKLSDTEAAAELENTWFLPHHAVTNPNKPGKVRVVFDAAASYKGTSLNDQLVTGPDLLNSLVGVVMRFRLHAIAITADIESMFFQVRVIKQDQPSLRFLWRGSERKRPPEVYQMQAIIFGAKSSPCSASYCLKQTALDHHLEYDQNTIQTVARDFYMDDLLKSLPSEQEAIRLALQIIDLLSRGGFHLTKFMSNSREVLTKLPVESYAHQTLDLDLESLPVERALGVLWNAQRDTLEIKIVPTHFALTKRGILKQTSTIFDPLGLVVPVLLKARLIIQELWRREYTWDQPITGPISNAWKTWKMELPELSKLSVPRCYSKTEDRIVERQLHVFADASETAFGAVAYLRSRSEDGTYCCSFVFGKARLSPIKPLTVPRLELQAAVLAVQIGQTIQRELDIHAEQTIYWTDSTTVLQYIKSEKTRFHTFVANRVAELRDSSDPKKWRHVPGYLNVADDCSRGLSARDLTQESRWIHGPRFLWQDESSWPKRKICPPPDDGDPEVKVEIWSAFSNKVDSALMDPEKTSSWIHLLRVTSWIKRFVANCQRKLKGQVEDSGPLSAKEIESAEEFWIKTSQAQMYPDDMARLEQNRELHRSSDLSSLNPYIDDNGILRVGGRLKHAPIPYEARHPAILSRKHPIVPLILSHQHRKLKHSGVEHVFSELREKYWVPQVRSIIKKTIRSCGICKKHNIQPVPPMMASLPPSRLQAFTPPFHNTGVDYFGPIFVKERRSTVKRYGCLFTCLVTRAVHLEITHSMDTDSFIMALRRMIGRRGKPKYIYSDNGTNFVGAERELKDCLTRLNQATITDTLSREGTQWFFNPPSAPHFGGVWERLVRSAKRALKITLNGQLVNDETLNTVMVEVESLLNGRPLTHISVDHRDPEPITPNHFLIGRRSPNLSPDVFDNRDLCSRKRWRQAQVIADLFWRRWLREYIPNLTERRKWRQPVRELQPGDVVLVVNENIPRGQWSLGRVLKTFRGDGGQIRVAEVQTKNGIYKRPVVKLCLLEEAQPKVQ